VYELKVVPDLKSPAFKKTLQQVRFAQRRFTSQAPAPATRRVCPLTLRQELVRRYTVQPKEIEFYFLQVPTFYLPGKTVSYHCLTIYSAHHPLLHQDRHGYLSAPPEPPVPLLQVQVARPRWHLPECFNFITVVLFGFITVFLTIQRSIHSALLALFMAKGAIFQPIPGDLHANPQLLTSILRSAARALELSSQHARNSLQATPKAWSRQSCWTKMKNIAWTRFSPFFHDCIAFFYFTIASPRYFTIASFPLRQ
jgi:hypothetical protein